MNHTPDAGSIAQTFDEQFGVLSLSQITLNELKFFLLRLQILKCFLGELMQTSAFPTTAILACLSFAYTEAWAEEIRWVAINYITKPNSTGNIIST